ncbi:uncharacterized protein ASPGLDRAFT_51595 [Aspergillus glaucus CBS 516.65]|uniref:Uncharacterized protein n=1 Tax=Aspergillus glaucus CBS 516.65 TaxID=1160497 RepID=A0A1L9V8W8_ASPGL|nr:hypothetical protein ASPGLDRAFT_51595 [Aspergillus glaucus CBS 516.65]OJJ80386.1 hypothetical protein ASPGLDRAFT_51595 [Aspergillus glaucus CBS 516.65]
MKASTTENDPFCTTTAAETTLADKPPRDMILLLLRYIIKPTIGDHPIISATAAPAAVQFATPSCLFYLYHSFWSCIYPISGTYFNAHLHVGQVQFQPCNG